MTTFEVCPICKNVKLTEYDDYGVVYLNCKLCGWDERTDIICSFCQSYTDSWYSPKYFAYECQKCKRAPSYKMYKDNFRRRV